MCCAWLSRVRVPFVFWIFFVSPAFMFILYSMILLSTLCRRSAGIPDFLTADDMLGKSIDICRYNVDILRYYLFAI